ncbi:plasmid partitioning protein RepB (plasmid) [Sulfitobacter sp. OXR-159]|uniref:plasmid partitioning protein RepB n=1 Tax=Sulfitobacter sp. OXR-159 TaxID=3100174 RepID=UPI002AC8C273|nr:plasmid partitioning protein RepB [Sulfitobacter sp. OXR-159]WPZ31411.1 plasmid partitioning protein RepB [Sulfitobacter sp. OXR-159]
MARKGILSSAPANVEQPEKPKSPAIEPNKSRGKANLMPRGAVGALQSSLNRMQENAVQELDGNLIDMAGVEDRLGTDTQAQKQLQESLRTYGQQVPVLVRPHPKTPGRFEIVYGRRRLQALKALGMPVKAMVRQLDDHALVMAQGQENTARQDLSFIEKASFAAQLDVGGHDRQTIADALSIDLPMVSRMLKVGHAFELPFLRQIGSAPSIGRDRWMALVKLFEQPAAKARADKRMSHADWEGFNSDERFEAIFAEASAQPEKAAASPAPSAKPRTLRSRDGKALADIRSGKRGVTVTVPARSAEGFDTWLDAHAEELLQEIHDRWQKTRA